MMSTHVTCFFCTMQSFYAETPKPKCADQATQTERSRALLAMTRPLLFWELATQNSRVQFFLQPPRRC